MSIIEEHISRLKEQIDSLEIQEQAAYGIVKDTEKQAKEAKESWHPFYVELAKLKERLAAFEEIAKETAATPS